MMCGGEEWCGGAAGRAVRTMPAVHLVNLLPHNNAEPFLTAALRISLLWPLANIVQHLLCLALSPP